MVNEHVNSPSYEHDVVDATLAGASGGTVYYSRNGKVVTVNVANVTITTNTWFTIATLPAHYRPSTVIVTMGGYGSYGASYLVGIRIQTDGRIQAGISSSSGSASGVWGFVSFLAAD